MAKLTGFGEGSSPSERVRPLRPNGPAVVLGAATSAAAIYAGATGVRAPRTADAAAQPWTRSDAA